MTVYEPGIENTPEASSKPQGDEQMRFPKQGRAATALLKKRKRQAHRRSDAFSADRDR